MGSNIVKYEDKQLQKLGNTINIANKLLDIDIRNLHIIHLDDHNIFLKSVKFSLLKKLPNIIIKGFLNNEEALIYINECTQNKTKIDLIITDFNHPGPNGLIFAKTVREIEQKINLRIPIILLTMSEKNEELTFAIEDGVFDTYYSKDFEPQELIDFIKNNTSK